MKYDELSTMINTLKCENEQTKQQNKKHWQAYRRNKRTEFKLETDYKESSPIELAGKIILQSQSMSNYVDKLQLKLQENAILIEKAMKNVIEKIKQNLKSETLDTTNLISSDQVYKYMQKIKKILIEQEMGFKQILDTKLPLLSTDREIEVEVFKQDLPLPHQCLLKSYSSSFYIDSSNLLALNTNLGQTDLFIIEYDDIFQSYRFPLLKSFEKKPSFIHQTANKLVIGDEYYEIRKNKLKFIQKFHYAEEATSACFLEEDGYLVIGHDDYHRTSLWKWDEGHYRYDFLDKKLLQTGDWHPPLTLMRRTQYLESNEVYVVSGHNFLYKFIIDYKQLKNTQRVKKSAYNSRIIDYNQLDQHLFAIQYEDKLVILNDLENNKKFHHRRRFLCPQKALILAPSFDYLLFPVVIATNSSECVEITTMKEDKILVNTKGYEIDKFNIFTQLKNNYLGNNCVQIVGTDSKGLTILNVTIK